MMSYLKHSLFLAALCGCMSATSSDVVPAAEARPFQAQAKTVWDGVYTEAQAERGSSSFAASCARCHDAGGSAVEGRRPLTGAPFWKSYRESTVDRLFKYVRESMPNGAGGSLSSNTYLDLVAFILSRNDLPAGAGELTADSMVGIQIIAKDGPGELPTGTLVRVIGCLTRGEGNRWILNNATAGERVATGDTGTPEDATRTLGTGTFELKFALTPLTPFVGHRLRVRGLLMGDGGVDGLNVSATQSLANSCP
jgi:mono/diheme cytochrome c family protein